MPNESTKNAINQLRDAGYDELAGNLRDLVLAAEQHEGASVSVGFIEWLPLAGQMQLIIRLAGYRP